MSASGARREGIKETKQGEETFTSVPDSNARAASRWLQPCVVYLQTILQSTFLVLLRQYVTTFSPPVLLCECHCFCRNKFITIVRCLHDDHVTVGIRSADLCLL